MGFVLGWHFAFIRLAAGLLTVVLVATLVQHLVKDNEAGPASVELDLSDPQGSFLARWGKALWQLFWSTIPVYIGRTGARGGARLAVPACGWRYRQHADVGDCDGGGRLPVCDPNRGGDPDYSDHDDGWHGYRTGAGAAHHAAGGEPAVADHAA